MSMLDKKPSHKKALIGGAISIAILLCAAWLGLNHQYVVDQVKVWGYQPSESIEKIEGRIDFTDKGKFYFYATQPRVASSDEFNTGCPRQEMGSPILGCYDTVGRIFIYDITDKKLDGMEEVTAAHEMLHAVWGRMSTDDQTRIGALLRTEYQKHKDDDLSERMSYYERNEPGEFENELHSILGTEVRNLSPELEKYYGQYFDDRQKVLDLHDKYDAIFKDLKSRADVLYSSLSKLGPDLKARRDTYNKESAQFVKDKDAFNARATSGKFDSMAQFYSERAALVARSTALASDYDTISADIDSYKAKYDEYQSIASQIRELSQSIDSIKELQPTPSVE